ncbi:MAG: PIN domain-containing protein [Gaiellaceae bacterium]
MVAAAYLKEPAVRLVAAGAGHMAIAAELAETSGLRSDDVPDIEIAALAIEHGLVLASHDHGFRRFARLRFVDPLIDVSPPRCERHGHPRGHRRCRTACGMCRPDYAGAPR